ncbi:hypothetical protein TNIN_435681 [Trichonephila inaurata madagascariensis]|uniref:Uncharacterized protein n=1 Tax=Trichonephila inaurata madagascariensis TaxID=2747483 RepID=A0A8X6XXQ0_9ARAC|nr:hypothetical protein TNIN_435681 [Trichonephila inaurata madagascariensis]
MLDSSEPGKPASLFLYHDIVKNLKYSHSPLEEDEKLGSQGHCPCPPRRVGNSFIKFHLVKDYLEMREPRMGLRLEPQTLPPTCT